MNYKYSLLLCGAALCLIILPGCISKRADIELNVGGGKLTAENSREVQDDNNSFLITLPNTYDLITEMEDAGARLFKVAKQDADPAIVRMYIEENPAPIEQAISLLEQEETVDIISSEDVVVAGLLGKKMSIKLSYAPDVLMYYFLRAGSKTYVFSPAGGQQWDFFEQIVQSFKLAE